MNYYNMLFELIETKGVSGFENNVANKIKGLLKDRSSEVFTDNLGNVFARLYGKKRSVKKILIDAHIDEIGLMVTKIADNGMLKFCSIGGVDARILPASRVVVHAESDIFGVIGVLPPHVLSAEDYKKPIEIENMCIDIGYDYEKAVKKVSVGDSATLFPNASMLINDRVCAGALDNRCGVLSVIMAMDMIKDKLRNIDVELMFSTLEEFNQGGAKTGAYNSGADLCICVDVSHASTPDSGKENTYEMGGGALIGIAPSLNRAIGDNLISIAKKHEIPHQLEVMAGSSGTNAWVIEVVKKGVPCGLLSVPLKYMHTGAEVVDIKDIESTARLLSLFIKKLDSEV